MDERERAEAALRAVGFVANVVNAKYERWDTTATSVWLTDGNNRFEMQGNLRDLPALLAGGLTDDEREAVEFGMSALKDLGFNRPAELLRWLLIRTRGDA